jgi:hypothetical protein
MQKSRLTSQTIKAYKKVSEKEDVSNYFSLPKSVLAETFIKKNAKCDYMLSMNKIVSAMLILFFIIGSFAVAFKPVSAAELVENSWNLKTPMSQTRFGLGVAAVDGKIYAIGGFTNSVYLGLNERYDPVSDTWTTLTSMPTPRNDFTIAAYGGKIYCIGGLTPKEGGGWFRCVVNEVYDVASDSWSTKASFPVSGPGLQAYIMEAHVVDGKIFVIMACDLYMYDINTDLWTKKASMPTTTPTSKFSFVLSATADMSDKIVVVGDFPIAGSSVYSSVEKIMIYNTQTDVWSEGTNPPAKKIFGVVGVTTGVYAPQRVYVLGTETNYNYVYDPITDVWSTAKAMPTARYSFGVAVVDDILYAIGGGASNTYTNFLSVNEQYIPQEYEGAVTAPEPSNSPTFPVTPEPTNPTTSKPPDVSESTLTYSIVTVLAITIVTVAMGSFFYFRKIRGNKLKVMAT